MGEMHFDADLAAVQNGYTPPNQLSEIAGRRFDLHPLILAHPGCYPQLREWILRFGAGAGAHPAAPQPGFVPYAATLAPARRSGLGCFFIGCGGIAALAVLLFVGVLVLGGLTSSYSGSAPESTGDGTTRAQATAAFDAERTRYYELFAQLEGNPVAPLVADLRAFQLLEKSADDPATVDARIAELAVRAQELTAQLEQRIADAAIRTANASGSVTEGIVDEAGRGFIDIAWDAYTACSTSSRADEGRTTVGCTSGEPLAVHIAPESDLGGDSGMRQVVLHELSHLYMRADVDTSSGSSPSRASALIAQGHFQGSSEVFADCYALTYLNLWTLTFDGLTAGYGYVCGDEERALMRAWAAEVHAPMPQRQR